MGLVMCLWFGYVDVCLGLAWYGEPVCLYDDLKRGVDGWVYLRYGV